MTAYTLSLLAEWTVSTRKSAVLVVPMILCKGAYWHRLQRKGPSDRAGQCQSIPLDQQRVPGLFVQVLIQTCADIRVCCPYA